MKTSLTLQDLIIIEDMLRRVGRKLRIESPLSHADQLEIGYKLLDAQATLTAALQRMERVTLELQDAA